MGRRITGIEATRLFRSIMKEIYWCSELGIPLFSTSKSLCPDARPIRLVPPGDVRPAFKRDKEIIKTAITESLGKGVCERFFSKDSLVLLNKVQAIDAADEIIVDGYSIGIREYDIRLRKWIFKPMYYGVKVIVDEELDVYAIINRDSVKVTDLITDGDLALKNLPDDVKWVPAATKGKRVYCLLKKVAPSRFRVSKTWRFGERVMIEPKKASLDDAIRANREHLEYLEDDAIRFLKSVRRKGNALINISGGKDSTVTAYLAHKAGIDKAMFLDTCLEFPETIETVKKIADALSLDMLWIDSENAFWRNLDHFGPPARDYRWCCKIVKLSYIARNVRRRFGRIISVVGQRQYESASRALAGRLAPSGSTAGDLVAAPIQYWTSLEVHMYIKYRRLPLNPLYEMGYERIGCYMCPTSRLAEIDAVRETHRDLWDKWFGYLYSYARSHGLPREWVDYGFWRWRFKYPGEIIYLAKDLGLDAGEMIMKPLTYYGVASIDFHTEYRVCRTIFLHNVARVNLDMLSRYLKIVGLSASSRGNDYIEIRGRGVFSRIYIDGRLEVCAMNKNMVLNAVRRVLPVIYMVGRCHGCGLCEISCPRGAFRGREFIETLCDGCRRCIHVCPSASHYTKSILAILKESLRS